MRALTALVFAPVFALVCAVLAPAASAQTRDAIFAISVVADSTAANSAQARTAALASANQIGFERLTRRLTAAADFARIGVPALTPQQLENMVSSVDVEEERRSGTRYMARVTLRFDPTQVRAALRGAGYTLIEATGPAMAVFPQAPGADADTAAAWRAAWTTSGYQRELSPLITVPEPVDGPADWGAAAPFARGAASALFATLSVRGSTASAAIVEVGPNNQRRDRGTVSAAITGDEAATFAALVAQANDAIQGEYKLRAASLASTGGRISASALYADQAEWERIKDALERAATTRISEIRIEAVGREGALVSFSYTGGQDDLVAELRRQGVSLENAAYGPVLRAAARR